MYKPPRCKICVYWRKESKTHKKRVVGQCKAGLPELGPTGYGFWPMTSENDFCYKGAHIKSPLLTERSSVGSEEKVILNERVVYSSNVPDKPTPPPAPPVKRYDSDDT